ncbi:unnamed protein product [Phytophthora fragariaefolia]|uniref:Unnamed protein product n=1 Tax=Phytophthora fragariaefolia TaxID=1490495 RepID=A0A9W6U4K2_9STRA|nr:unnamed protein product [Phytophthora fragariaefolia]
MAGQSSHQPKEWGPCWSWPLNDMPIPTPPPLRTPRRQLQAPHKGREGQSNLSEKHGLPHGMLDGVVSPSTLRHQSRPVLMPGVVPLEAAAIIDRDIVEAVDGTGDMGVIGENGGLETLGTDANESVSPSAETAILEAGANDAVADEAEGGDRALGVGLLSLAAADAAPPITTPTH